VAKVKSFDKERIKRLHGVIDFYYWKGIPVARKWPDWSHFKPSEKQKGSMAAFAQAMKDMKLITPHVRDVWRSLCLGKKPFWFDDYKSKYMGYWRDKGVLPNVMLDFIDMGG